MTIKYSAFNQFQHTVLNSLIGVTKAHLEYGEVIHGHFCKDCGGSWGHSNPSCTEPEDVTLICPNCEQGALANDGSEDQKYMNDHMEY